MTPGTCLVVQWVGLHLPMQRVRIQSLVRELGSHMPDHQKNQDMEQKQKTLKIVHIKKSFKNERQTPFLIIPQRSLFDLIPNKGRVFYPLIKYINRFPDKTFFHDWSLYNFQFSGAVVRQC